MRRAPRHKVPAALLTAVVTAGLVLAAVVGITVGSRGSGTHHTGTHSTGTHSTGTHGTGTHGGAQGHSGMAARGHAASTRGASWLASPAGRLLEAVNADLGRLSTGRRAGQRGVARAAGARLAAAAGAALSGPMPPANAKIYRSALKDLKRAGLQAASGKFGNADTLLNAGGSGMTKFTSALNNLGDVAPPGP